MKVLIACNRNSYKNPYVATLADGLIAMGVDITCSLDEFWSNSCNYDVIHIQWPNLLVKKNDSNCSLLKKTLTNIRKNGIPIVVTLHNLIPHYCNEECVYDAYKVVYESADYIIHMGEISIGELHKQMPYLKAKNFVIPHHTYDTLYCMNVDKGLAKKKLGIPNTKKCVLSFGSFRDDEERRILTSLSDACRDFYFLAPGFYRGEIFRKNIKLGFSALLKTIKYSLIAWRHRIHICHRYVSDEMLPYYMAAADVLLISRVKILNSGNVSMAMLAGVPIVGPNVGNVGWILNKSGNRTFDVNHLENLPTLVRESLKDPRIGMSNKNYSEKFLKTMIVARQVMDVYEKIVKKDRK